MSPDVISSVIVPTGREAGAPCLTYLDPMSGERTELSGRTVALWVAKTANLVQDELGLEPGDVVALRLPAHWQAWTWLFGAWLAGCVVDVAAPNKAHPPNTERPLPDDAEVGVVPFAALATDSEAGAVPLVSLALRPMALPGPPPPAGVLDFDISVRGHGDRYTARPGIPPGRLRIDGQEVAWTELLTTELLTTDDSHDGPGRRLLTTLAPTSLEAVSVVVRALAAGSGVVLLAPDTGADRATWATAATKALAGEAVTRSTPECRDLLT